MAACLVPPFILLAVAGYAGRHVVMQRFAARLAPGVVGVEEGIYVVGGYSGSRLDEDVAFDPSSATRTVHRLPFAPAHVTGFVHGDTLFALATNEDGENDLLQIDLRAFTAGTEEIAVRSGPTSVSARTRKRAHSEGRMIAVAGAGPSRVRRLAVATLHDEGQLERWVRLSSSVG